MHGFRTLPFDGRLSEGTCTAEEHVESTCMGLASFAGSMFRESVHSKSRTPGKG
jgi:hypothetical protein